MVRDYIEMYQDYQVDMLMRPHDISGQIPKESSGRRSRYVQARAGGKDRLPTDDGGHYVAPRFGGAPHPINHFPQNFSINWGQYRSIEDQWDKARAAGHKVTIHIVPYYKGTSLRPYALDVGWTIDGHPHHRKISNQKGEN